MSHITYNKLWGEAQTVLDEVTVIDVDQQSAKPTKDKKHAHITVGELYVKYSIAIKKLEECYDQIVQPQKRLVIRKLLDMSIGRYLEIKHYLVNLDLSEFCYFDDMLSQYNLLPMDAELPVPTYYRRERRHEISERKKTLDDILKKLGFYEEEPTGIVLTEYEAIRLIQIHERARQGRLRSQFMKEIRLLKEKVKIELPEDKVGEINKTAAVKIQKLWRGYITRRKIRKRVIDEMLLIGNVFHIWIHYYKLIELFKDTSIFYSKAM